jgi:5-methylcytosine-specific restriction endonuclease McrA
MGMKFCKKCGIIKDITEFYRSSKKRDGHASACKKCQNAVNKAYKIKNEEKIMTYQENYRKEHKEKMSSYFKERYEATRDEQLEYRKQHYASNKEQYAKSAKNYYISNKETILNSVKAWAKIIKNKRNEYKRRRRALKRNSIVENFSLEEVFNKYGNQCFYCKMKNFEHLDHFVPLSKGGAHTLENVRPSCAECNMKKHTLMPDEFYLRYGK